METSSCPLNHSLPKVGLEGKPAFLTDAPGSGA